METLRTSSYIIPVKQEKEEGKYMLIHGYTGAIDIVTESLLEKIKSIDKGHDFSESMLQTLLKRGYITTKTQEEEYAYTSRIVNTLHKEAKALYKTFTIIVTYKCNFRCPYCFEGRSMKDNDASCTITPDKVDKFYSCIEELAPYEALRNKTITLYGGEPLLAENRDIIKYIVYQGKRRGYNFCAITNGYDLDHFIDLLSPELIKRVQITIDGTKEYHNQKRIHYKGYDTFNRIIANVKLALEKKVTVIIRVNNDNNNVDDFVRLKEYFEKQGFFNYPTFHLYSILLWNSKSITEKEHQSLDFLTPTTYLSKHREMGTLKLGKDFGVAQRIYKALVEGKPIPFRAVYCSSQVGEHIFDPYGNIYPCWEMVGNKDYLIGNYGGNKIIWNEEKLQSWRNYNITANPYCRTCKYALFCGGGCVAHIMAGNREDCIYFKTMFKNSVNRAFERKLINNHV